MYVVRICVLALCWPIGAKGARDESLHTHMELEVRQNSVMMARSRHEDMARDKIAQNTTKKEHDIVVSQHAPHKFELKSHFWQETVPLMLGLGKFDATVCAEDKTHYDSDMIQEWYNRLRWVVPVMLPSFLLLLGCPFLYCLSSGSVRKEMGGFILSYAGFFMANWAMLAIMNQFATHYLHIDLNSLGMGNLNIAPFLMIFTVAIGGVIFRVVAAALNEGISCDHDSAIIKPTNVYMNLNRSICEVIMRFIGQQFLMWLYCAELEHMTEQLHLRFCAVPRVHFVCIILGALPCLQGVLRAALGKDFIANLGPWMKLSRSRGYKVVGEEQGRRTSRMEIYMRIMMGFVVNQVYQGILLFTIQTLCFQVSYLDFVKDLFAVAFITTLDDEGGDVTEIQTIGEEDDKEGEPT